MLNLKKRTHCLVLTSLAMAFSYSAVAKDHCPDLTQIKHTPGEYSWSSKIPGWEGAFVAPLTARGYSTEVKRFSQARWIQFSNLPNSPGYIQCDYIGNIGEEVIRFSQVANKATKRPDDEIWTKVTQVRFPSVQRECSVSVEMCQFEQL